MPGLAFEADTSLNADVIARLRGATDHMLRQMRDELNTLFAIPTSVTSGTQEGTLSGAAGAVGVLVPQFRMAQRALRPNGFRFVLQTAGSYEAPYAALRQRFLAATRRANPALPQAQLQARLREVMSHLDIARRRLSSFLNSGRTVTITINNPEDTRSVLQSWMTMPVSRQVYCNPFTFYVRSRAHPNAYVRALREGTPSALAALGPTIAMLHETDHVEGCMIEQNNTCSTIHSRYTAEQATTRDVDGALRNHPAVAQTGVYQDPGANQVAILGNDDHVHGYRSHYRDNPNETPPPDLPAQWVRWPSMAEMRHGLAPAGR